MEKDDFLLTPCLFEQLGDSSTTHRPTPVNVSGLTSGVVSVALGYVRLFCVIHDFYDIFAALCA